MPRKRILSDGADLHSDGADLHATITGSQNISPIWLSWPGAKKVDQWITGFLKALASAKKHSILISVTLKEVAQVRHESKIN